jgi:CO/xanthine dehydrogenase Mo-binding subunit
MNAPRLTRRDFTAGLGGIVLSFSLGPELALAQDKPARLPGSLNNNRLLSAWIAINADGTATVMTGKVELGQGILTALWQIAAEELDLPLARVNIVSGDTGRTPNEGQTAGSQSVQNSGTALRLAGAEVRAILLELASKRLSVVADSLKVSDGVITAPDGRKVTYGELARAADLKREATGKVRPRPPAQHKLVGRSAPRIDIPAKVTGGEAYVQDLRLPGMLHGRVARPPQYGAQLESFDEAKVRAMPGVVAVVRDGSFLGVVAAREEQAIKAADALKASAKWKAGPALPDPAHLYDALKKLPTLDTVIGHKDAPLPAGTKVLEATYHRPYTAHAAIGPSCGVAQLQD